MPASPPLKLRAEEYTTDEIRRVASEFSTTLRVASIISSMAPGDIIGVTGPRGAGKSFNVLAAITGRPHLYIYFDKKTGRVMRRAYMVPDDPLRVPPNAYLVIDDIHYMIDEKPDEMLWYLETAMKSRAKRVIVSDDDLLSVLIVHGYADFAYKYYMHIPTFYVEPYTAPIDAIRVFKRYVPEASHYLMAAAAAAAQFSTFRDVLKAAMEGVKGLLKMIDYAGTYRDTRSLSTANPSPTTATPS